MRIKTAVCSSVGVKRRINQDNFYVNGFTNANSKAYIMKTFWASSSEKTLCICDGMGGEECGEIASLLAVETLSTYIKKHGSLTDKFDRYIQAFTLSANRVLCDYMKSNGIDAMGSTYALMCVSPESGTAMAANVGDSKVYMYRDGFLSKLSVDHNEAQRLVELEMLSDEKALTHEKKSKLTQHLGIPPEEMLIEPTISECVSLHKGDIFLLCSDGLTDMLNFAEIVEILSRKNSVKAQCKALVDTANAHGGTDNTTVILCKVI